MNAPPVHPPDEIEWPDGERRQGDRRRGGPPEDAVAFWHLWHRWRAAIAFAAGLFGWYLVSSGWGYFTTGSQLKQLHAQVDTLKRADSILIIQQRRSDSMHLTRVLSIEARVEFVVEVLCAYLVEQRPQSRTDQSRCTRFSPR